MTLEIKHRLGWKGEVANLEEASRLYCSYRDKSGEGASTWPEGIVRNAADGRRYRISYNGRIWRKAPHGQVLVV